MSTIEAPVSSRHADSSLDPLDPTGLFTEAMAARLRGDTAEGDRLEHLAREADQADRYRRDLAAAIAWAPKVAKVEPADPFAKYRALVAAGEPGVVTDLAIHSLPDTPAKSGATRPERGSTSKRETPKTYSHVSASTGPCGVLRLLRVKGRDSVLWRARCKRRSCETCRPLELNKKFSGIPEGRELYGVEVHADQWAAKAEALRRRRSAGKAGDYIAIPLDAEDGRRGRVLVVTDAPDVGGRPITTTQVRERLDLTPTRARITASRAWQAEKAVPLPDDVRDDGIVTASERWLVGKAAKMGLPGHRDPEGNTTFTCTTDAEHEQLREAGGVISDAEYHQQLAAAGRVTGKRLAGMHLAGWRPPGAAEDDAHREGLALFREAGFAPRRMTA